MLTISRRKIALDPPLYIVLMDDLVLQSKHLFGGRLWSCTQSGSQHWEELDLCTSGDNLMKKD